MQKVSFDIPDDIPADEARLTLAIGLYREGRVSQGQAARIAGYSRGTFIELLIARGGPVSNITLEDFERELCTLRELRSQTVPR